MNNFYLIGKQLVFEKYNPKHFNPCLLFNESQKGGEIYVYVYYAYNFAVLLLVGLLDAYLNCFYLMLDCSSVWLLSYSLFIYRFMLILDYRLINIDY